ncbi:uncharacterized protein [Rutidosis leptorrhynchoides]|uniref:uncharacterized protein n=1 Tax=Rutidosis leptorrhynchoides TaxID=125765 RepID=UPI003A99B526
MSTYGNGGLNIGSLKGKNLALLGKWWWRFKTETNSFWVKIIRSIYGPSGGLEIGSDLGHSPSSGAWKNIIIAGNLIEDLNIPFRNTFSKSVGNGSSTSFWNEQWIGNNKLSERFPRLYRLEKSPDALIRDRIDTSEPNSVFAWDWSRVPGGRTAGELQNLISMLSEFVFDSGSVDKWKWSLNSNGIFTVKVLSSHLDEQILSGNTYLNETLRNNLVPKKLEIFAWRVLKYRIPVRLELDKRGIDLHTVRCPICDDDLESVEHSLIFCNISMDIWCRVFNWWRLGNFSNLSISEILRGNASVPMTSFGRLIWQAVDRVGRNSTIERDRWGQMVPRGAL